MSRRKLALLDYAAEIVDCDDVEKVRELVAWLEDQHIRLYAISDREDLRSYDADVFHGALVKYLAALECPLKVDVDSMKEIVDWLLDYAISVIYSQNETAASLTAAKLKEMRDERAGRQRSDDPISALDFSSEDFKKGIEEIRILLGIAPHPDWKVVLKGVCKFISANLSAAAIESANKRSKTDQPKPAVIQLSEVETGTAPTKDSQVDAAVRALRLLHLQNLREVQTEINETIVAVQEITADPKTDKSLGKVGF